MRVPLSCVASLLFSSSLIAAPATPAIPTGLGVDIHFTSPKEGEMEQLAAGGFTVVRMDFDWIRTEKQRGIYDWSQYETLLKALEPHKIRALFILDYANPLYDDNRSPDTDEGHCAFATWAAAAAKHFAGRGILWEMYNEPNIFPFWRPKPNPDDYVKLALETGKAIRAAAPDETYIGPATSGVDLPFLETCFKAGLLEYFSAVTVHPYRQHPPETVADDYRKLRLLIEQYKPKEKSIPIYSGEWGYSSVWAGMDEAKQGKYLPRQWLTNICNDVPLSIWYDWHDDGPDPKEPEHHFGTVHLDYTPKPAYLAAKTLSGQLAGYRFNKRLALEDADDHLMIFEKAVDPIEMVDREKYQRLVLAAWTAATSPHRVRIPASPGRFKVTSHSGEPMADLVADRDGLHLTLTDAVVYLVPEQPNDLLRLAAAWSRLQTHYVWRRGDSPSLHASLNNPLDRSFRYFTPAHHLASHVKPHEGIGGSWNCPPTRASEPITWRAEIEISGFEESNPVRFVQDTRIVSLAPLHLILLPPRDGAQRVRVENPTGGRFEGKLRLKGTGQESEVVRFDEDETVRHVSLPHDDARPTAIEVLEQDEVVLTHPPTRLIAIDLDPAHFTLQAEGDKDVPSEQSLAKVARMPAADADALRINYRFDPGWKYVCLKPEPRPRPLEGKPTALAMWITGDGSGNILRARLVDATGQTFQPDGPKMNFRDSRYISFPLDGSKGGHWGGANDGVIHYPVRLETLLLIDSADRGKTAGSVKVEWATVVYEGSASTASSPP